MKRSKSVIFGILGRLALAIALCAIMLCTPGCGALGLCGDSSIPATALEQPVQAVTQRHDAYILADETLSPAERDLYLRTSEMLRALVDEAQFDSGKAAADPVN